MIRAWEIRLGRQSLGWGIFYHWQKRALYIHPVPGFGLVLHFGNKP